MECGRTKELQEMTPKKLLNELEDREREFHKVSDIVKNHRSGATCKNVWITRNGDFMKEDLNDARELPGIKDQLEKFDAQPGKFQQATISTLFSAAEGVSRAKSLAYFDEIKNMKEQLTAMARKDDKEGTTTTIKLFGQQDNANPWDVPRMEQQASAAAPSGQAAPEGRQALEQVVEVDGVLLEEVPSASAAPRVSRGDNRLDNYGNPC